MLLVLVLGACSDAVQGIAGADATRSDGAVDGGADAQQPDAAVAPEVRAVEEGGRDDVAVVGEWITARGPGLGPACTAAFGAVPARVDAAPGDGLRFQVPEGIAVGPQSVKLECPGGVVSVSLRVKRYHLVTLPVADQIAILEQNSPGEVLDSGRRLDFVAPDAVALSPDSAFAYVGTAPSHEEAPSVAVIELAAAGGPALLPHPVPWEEPVRMPVFDVAAAADAPLLAVAGGLYVVLYDLADAARPRRVGAIQLVQAAPGEPAPEVDEGFFTRAALTPDGTHAVLLDGAADLLAVFDVTQPATPRVVHEGLSVSQGTPVKPVVGLPFPLSGLLGLIKVRGGSAQDLALSADGRHAAVLSGGGVGALSPETYNLDLRNSALSIVDVRSGAYVAERIALPDAHVPSNVAYAPGGELYATSMSASSAVVIKILFQIGVGALIGGGLDLVGVAGVILGSFFEVIDVVQSLFNGSLLDLGGLHTLAARSSAASFRHIPYVQGGLCATYDGAQLVAASQGWRAVLELGGLQVVKRFEFGYELGATIHEPAAATYAHVGLFPWQAKMLLPPWTFGQAACQQ